MIILNNNINILLNSLSKSKFRGSFHLNKKMKDYVKEKGLDKIKSDARDLITKRLAQENPINDGKQTPMKQVHPCFYWLFTPPAAVYPAASCRLSSQ